MSRDSHGVRYRRARAEDAERVARLHADSWRRHYRGAYSDAFLDGDVLADRLAVWSERLGDAGWCGVTILAERAGLIGFAHAIPAEDPTWGALLDNMHVAAVHKREGIGSRLLSLAAEAVVERDGSSGLYLWVLEQNHAAQAFYESRGGRRAGIEPVQPPGGVAGRLQNAPAKLRYTWPRAAMLLARQRA
jgi:ribosomal protein S18 acetylase RimI-like enzyme